MANNFTPVGNELQINLAPNQNDDQFDPDVALLTDGRFFVAFEDDDTNPDIIGQFVNADGTLSGSNIDIEIDAGNQVEPAVAQRASGAAIVVWHDEAVSDEIHYAIVSSAGGVGTEQAALDGNPWSRPDVATLADGRSLIVATQDNAGNLDIGFRLIDAAGAPIGVADFIDNGTDDQDAAATATFANNALVVYADETATPDSTDIQARFFNGSSFSAEVTIADSGENDDPDVAALIDGRFIVVWDDDATDSVLGRFVSATGTPLGSAFTISSGGGDSFFARVAALPDGGFIVTWNNDGGDSGSEVDAGDDAVLARRFDSSGAPAGDEFLVNTGDPDTNQENPAIAANPLTGQAFIAWDDFHAFTGADNDPEGVRGRAFVTTTDTVNGTEGDDLITSYSLGEPINGLGGDDTINGLAGNDVIHGGAGFDHIKGGLGNDQIFGEGGEDLVKGEDGDDLLVGGLGRDVQLGGGGADSFDFNKLAESRSGAKHDVIQGFHHSEHDRIDLKSIDADTTAGGNQAFDLIGAAAFSGTAGELRFTSGLLQGDVNGDGIADLEVRVIGLGSAVNGDFVL